MFTFTKKLGQLLLQAMGTMFSLFLATCLVPAIFFSKCPRREIWNSGLPHHVPRLVHRVAYLLGINRGEGAWPKSPPIDFPFSKKGANVAKRLKHDRLVIYAASLPLIFFSLPSPFSRRDLLAAQLLFQ